MTSRIGFMQGRLSPKVNGMIQAFPWNDWEGEFASAEAIGLTLMEWTLDYDRLCENPLLTEAGRARIGELSRRHGVEVGSLTGDCFMQAPFWKAPPDIAQRLKADFDAICQACSAVGIRYVVVPLVDNGRLENATQEDRLIDHLVEKSTMLVELGLQILFESDFKPSELARFIGRLDSNVFGINYDTGNSAALGWSPTLEFEAYGTKVRNVHIKDRLFGGTTVPLGSGSTKFKEVFAALATADYRGDFILQTARAENDRHAEVLGEFRDMTAAWIGSYLGRTEEISAGSA